MACFVDSLNLSSDERKRVNDVFNERQFENINTTFETLQVYSKTSEVLAVIQRAYNDNVNDEVLCAFYLYNYLLVTCNHRACIFNDDDPPVQAKCDFFRNTNKDLFNSANEREITFSVSGRSKHFRDTKLKLSRRFNFQTYTRTTYKLRDDLKKTIEVLLYLPKLKLEDSPLLLITFLKHINIRRTTEFSQQSSDDDDESNTIYDVKVVFWKKSKRIGLSYKESMKLSFEYLFKSAPDEGLIYSTVLQQTSPEWKMVDYVFPDNSRETRLTIENVTAAEKFEQWLKVEFENPLISVFEYKTFVGDLLSIKL